MSTTAEGMHDLVRRIEQSSALDPGLAPLARASAALDEGAAGDALRGEWLGHALHPALTDLPLGCWTSAILLDLVGGRRSRAASRRLIGIGLLAALPTAASGVVDAGGLGDHRSRRVAVAHALGNSVALMCFLRSWRLRRRGRAHVRSMTWSLLGGGASLASGYLGGHLAFGAPVDPPSESAERSPSVTIVGADSDEIERTAVAVGS